MAPVIGAVIGSILFIIAALIQVSICHKAWIFWVSISYLAVVYIVIQVFWILMGKTKVEIYTELDPDWAESESEGTEKKSKTDLQE